MGRNYTVFESIIVHTISIDLRAVQVQHAARSEHAHSHTHTHIYKHAGRRQEIARVVRI